MPKPEPGNAAAFGPAISAYTRAQAIEDGILVDVSDTAREAGFNIPVTVTRTVWNRLIALPEGYRGFQDERGRLWDVLWMARHYALRSPTCLPHRPRQCTRWTRAGARTCRRCSARSCAGCWACNR